MTKLKIFMWASLTFPTTKLLGKNFPGKQIRRINKTDMLKLSPISCFQSVGAIALNTGRQKVKHQFPPLTPEHKSLKKQQKRTQTKPPTGSFNPSFLLSQLNIAARNTT